MNEGSAKQQIVEGIKANSNILVTVSDSPSVDELSAALGLTLLLNKIDKRATSIFSGAIPPAITFLDPAKTFEGTVDSLRDFIIALDKEKADHLRYKVDGDVVKIFITPYRTKLNEKDLEFSQGDYNVEMVIALGVKDQDHLDKALSAHGRILHDALVTTISVGADPSSLGSVDWRDEVASSLCEMLVSLSEALKGSQQILDEQIATALLTGIVSATDRFSNDRTSSRVMTMAAQLMAAGADQQLIAAKLQESHDIPPSQPKKDEQKVSGESTLRDDRPKKDKKPKQDDNSLTIERDDKKSDKKPKDQQAQPKKDAQADAGEPAQVPAFEAAAVAAAVEQAEPAKDVEEELSKKLDEVIEPTTATAAVAPEELEKELNDALVEESAEPVVPPADDPAPVAMPPTEDIMPGFEALDVPAPSTPVSTQPDPADDTDEPDEPEKTDKAPSQERSPMIRATPGSEYVTEESTPPFDVPVSGIVTPKNIDEGGTVDPFSAPLPPMPQLPDVPSLSQGSPLNDQSADDAASAPPSVIVDDPSAIPTLEELERAQEQSQAPLPPPPQVNVPPLPPLPDFSTLPPLPSPPPPPVFDQPPVAPAQPGPVEGDKLGDIFGDAPAQPDIPAAPQEPSTPPPPGQFRIPGQ